MSKKIISPHVMQALKIIARRLEGDDINWVIIASCALALQGLDVDPVDIDIMTDESGHLIINKVLAEYKMALSENSPSPIFDSTLGKFAINSCLVEVMSNFKIKSRSDDQWHEMKHLLQHRDMIVIQGLTVPVLPVMQLIEMYKLMGREKDLAKIEKMERYLLLDA